MPEKLSVKWWDFRIETTASCHPSMNNRLLFHMKEKRENEISHADSSDVMRRNVVSVERSARFIRQVKLMGL